MLETVKGENWEAKTSPISRTVFCMANDKQRNSTLGFRKPVSACMIFPISTMLTREFIELHKVTQSVLRSRAQ